MSKVCVIHASVPGYVVVRNGKVEAFIVDPTEYGFDQPGFVTDLEGGPVSDEEHNDALVVAMRTEGEWMYRAVISELRSEDWEDSGGS